MITNPTDAEGMKDPQLLAQVSEHREQIVTTFKTAVMMGRQCLETGVTPESFERLSIWRDSLQDSINEHFLDVAAKRGTKAACKAGCSMCCYQHVLVSSSAAFWMLKHLTGEAPDYSTFAALAARYSHLERTARTIPCVMLDEKTKRCRVYEARPEACRSHFSVSLFACRKSWATRHDRKSEVDIPYIAQPKFINHGANMGFDAALMERGIQICNLEIAEALKQASVPGAFERWLAGEKVFETAVNDNYVEAVDNLLNYGDLALDYR